MKAKLVVASLILAASSAYGTVSLQFNSPTEGSLTNFATSSGVAGTQMVWGIIIDQGGNGFSFNAADTKYDTAGLTYTGASLQALTLLGGGATDDVLFLSPVAMTLAPVGGVDDAPAGTNRVTTIVNVPFGAPTQIGVGDAFAIVWFDQTTLSGGAIQGGTKYGVVTNPGLTIPANSAVQPYTEFFVGADPLKTQNFTIGVPEPSSMFLGLLGVAGLLRRRR